MGAEMLREVAVMPVADVECDDLHTAVAQGQAMTGVQHARVAYAGAKIVAAARERSRQPAARHAERCSNLRQIQIVSGVQSADDGDCAAEQYLVWEAMRYGRK